MVTKSCKDWTGKELEVQTELGEGGRGQELRVQKGGKEVGGTGDRGRG